jgi:class 3 adenylate cyclase
VLELQARMGINTGWAVVGGIGDQLRRGLYGDRDTTNLAARLQQLAEPEAILVSADTSRFLQGVARLEPLRPLQVKGEGKLSQAFRLLSLGLLQSEMAVLGAMAWSSLVGRQQEMAILEDRWERAAVGQER